MRTIVVISIMIVLLLGCSLHSVQIRESDSSQDNNDIKYFTSTTGKQYAFTVRYETDEFKDEEEPSSHGILGFIFSEDNDTFRGEDRRIAKTSIYGGSRKKVADTVSELYSEGFLPTDDYMRNELSPPLTKDVFCDRVDEENYSIVVKKAFICAIKIEEDNDFHIILCDKQKKHFFTAELSGIPRGGSSKELLEKVRDDFKGYFGDELPSGGKYAIWTNDTIELLIEGSLFYDVDHAPGQIGPRKEGYIPKTAWEIHPITKLVFK